MTKWQTAWRATLCAATLASCNAGGSEPDGDDDRGENTSSILTASPKPSPLTLGQPYRWQGAVPEIPTLNPSNGNFVRFIEVFSLTQPNETSLDIELAYNSRADIDTSFGKNWTLTTDVWLEPPASTTAPVAVLTWGDLTSAEYYQSGSGAFHGDPGDSYRLTYDPASDEYRVDPPGDAPHYILAPSGSLYRLDRIEDRNGNVVSFNRATDGRILTIQDAVGRTITFSYQNGRITEIAQPDGSAYALTHDTSGRLTSVKSPDFHGHRPQVAFSYDSAGFLAQEYGDYTLSFTYEADGALVGFAGSGGTLSVAYTADQVTVTDSIGNARALRFQDEVVREHIHHDGSVESFMWNADRQQVAYVDRRGLTQTMEYDAQGRLTRRTDPQTGAAEAWTYDAAGRVATYADLQGRVTSYTYGPHDMVQSEARSGRTRSYARDAAGNALALQDFDGTTVQYTYNGRGQITSETDEAGATRYWSYDTYGEVQSYTSETGRTWTFTSDVMGLVTSMTEPEGGTTQYEYNPWGGMKRILPASAGGVQAFSAPIDCDCDDPPYCGDGICQDDESCGGCPEDCGSPE